MYTGRSYVAWTEPNFKLFTEWHMLMFAVSAEFCFVHSPTAILQRQAIQIQSIYRRVLVRASGLGVQNTCACRRRGSYGMHVCNDRNTLGLLPTRIQAVVAEYSPDRNQDAVSPTATPNGLDSAYLQHLGTPAPGSSWRDRHNPSQHDS